MVPFFSAFKELVRAERGFAALPVIVLGIGVSLSAMAPHLSYHTAYEIIGLGLSIFSGVVLALVLVMYVCVWMFISAWEDSRKK